jgi:hypothetical protein
MTRDPYILSKRIRVMHNLPWAIPATLMVRLTDQHLDELDLAERTSRDAYWLALGRIVHELTQESKA